MRNAHLRNRSCLAASAGRRALHLLALLACTALFAGDRIPARAQAPAAATGPTQASDGYKFLQRIFDSADFRAQPFGPARWLDDGISYTTLERAGGRDSAAEVVRYDVVTGKRTVLVDAAQLTPKGAKEPLEINDYAWSTDKSQLLIFTNTRRVWRQNTRGDYWLLHLASGALKKLGRSAPESSLMFAKFSSDGTRVAYVSRNNIYVESIATGKVKQLTSDGSEIIINGTSDWVYEEELDLRDAFRWSPDGKRIAFWQFDSSGVGTFPLVYNVGAANQMTSGFPYPGTGKYPTVLNLPYPLAGTTNSAARIAVIPAAGGKPCWIQISGDPRDNYIARMEWAGNSRELIIQHLNRLQNTNEVLIADAASGAVRRAHREQDAAWLDVYDLHLLGDAEFLWLSEKSGWRQAYCAARDGSGLKPITRGEFDVISVAEVDRKGGWLYFIASPENPTQRYLFRARLDGTGQAERLTPANQPGTHAYQVAPGGGWAIHTYSRFDTPPVIDLVELPAHNSVRRLEENAAARENAAEVMDPPVEFFRIQSDGITFDAWMIRPPEFDPSKKYPLLMFVYGEPGGLTVTDSWGGNRMLFHRAVARAGFIVASIDTRGTPAPRGRDWRKVIYPTIGPLSTKDHSGAVRQLLRMRPYLDASRVAVWGWSGGGTSTLNLIFRAPEVYKLGMSVAPVPDQRLYDTIYQERYMGLPTDNAEGYKNSSPINFAEGLRGRLLIVHGSGDDNVHIQGTEMLVNRLIELGKKFDYFVYPGRSHAIAEGTGTSVHIYSLLFRYLLENMPRVL
jgi:dipeptidyl-peptidase-4